MKQTVGLMSMAVDAHSKASFPFFIADLRKRMGHFLSAAIAFCVNICIVHLYSPAAKVLCFYPFPNTIF